MLNWSLNCGALSDLSLNCGNAYPQHKMKDLLNEPMNCQLNPSEGVSYHLLTVDSPECLTVRLIVRSQ